jgi:hypothetical protein
MSEDKTILTKEILLDEYTNWRWDHGAGRNNQDLRFGQFIWNKYDMISMYDGKTPDISNDGFYTETPAIAYNQILANLI